MTITPMNFNELGNTGEIGQVLLPIGIRYVEGNYQLTMATHNDMVMPNGTAYILSVYSAKNIKKDGNLGKREYTWTYSLLRGTSMPTGG